MNRSKSVLNILTAAFIILPLFFAGYILYNSVLRGVDAAVVLTTNIETTTYFITSASFFFCVYLTLQIKKNIDVNQLNIAKILMLILLISQVFVKNYLCIAYIVYCIITLFAKKIFSIKPRMSEIKSNIMPLCAAAFVLLISILVFIIRSFS